MNKMDLNKLVSQNQTIKIVPSIEEFLHSTGLNVDLDDNVKLWLNQLKVTWKTWKRSPTIESHIEMFYCSVPDPHRVALVFVIKCEEFKDCKAKTLPFFIIETLLKWSKANGVSPEESLKLPAYHVAIQQRSQHFLKLIVKTYNVDSIKEKILPLVKDMIKEDNCRHASQIVTALELYDDIPVEDLMFPLILQDKSNIIDDYLTECPDQVKPLLSFLDKLLDKNISIREYVQNYIEEKKIGYIKYEKLHYKPLGKLVARLCNKFNIPIETCTNLSKNRTIGGLRYLIHQKYIENNVSLSVWDDLVKDSLRQSAGSAKEFIEMLIVYNRKEAMKWAEYLQIPENELPLALKDISLNEQTTEEEDWDAEVYSSAPQEYYKFDLSDSRITIIDNGEKFFEMMHSHLAECTIVSIDCEWKPSFGASQSQVALIQIATLNNVYLIDTLILNKQEYSSFWYTFHKSLLDNAEIIKVGFGLEQDLREVKASVVGLSNIKVKGEGLLDLILLWKSLLDSGLILPSNSDNGGSSLSCLVQSCFGLPLEKSEQCSNWELRPLRSTQIQYAALDAHVLLQIYCFLQKLCQRQGINFEEICNDVMLEGKKKCSKKTKPEKQVVDMQPVKSTQEFKILVEPMLSNLMTYLRCCGVDTIVMPTTMLWCDAINLAISDDRLIILSKLKYTPTNNFPQRSILDVGKGTVKDQVQKILTHFNVSVRETDLLTRCLICNSDELRKLSPPEVSGICNIYQCTVRYQRQVSDDEDVDYGNFLSDSDCDDYEVHPCQNVYHNNIPNKDCVTSKGVPVNITNVDKLSQRQVPGILCDDCGKLFWEDDELLKSVAGLVSDLTKLAINLH